MTYLFIFCLLALIIACGDIFLRGTIGISSKLKIPFFLLGATVIAVGTSSPDLFVGISAILKHKQDIMFGAIIGSTIANILLCFGLASLIYVIPCEKKDKSTKFGVYYNSLFVILVCTFLVLTGGKIGVAFSIFLICSFFFFIFCIIQSSKKDNTEEEKIKLTKIYNDIIFFAGGLFGLLFFSDLLVSLIEKLSIEKEIHEKTISASIVSFSNSIPEIITSILAAFKKRGKIIMGNVIGSNIFIVGGILGFTSLVYNIIAKQPATVSLHILKLDVPMFFLASMLLLTIFTLKSCYGKITGLIFIFIYLVYTLLQFNII